jgi:predicted Holliday junction resolvase-like endonuclease
MSINTIASSEDNYNDLPIDHIGIWRSLLIDPMESCHKLLTTATPQDTKVLNQAIDLLKAINFKGDTLSTVTMRKTLFDCLVLLCISCPEESLARLVAIRIETTESVNNIGSTNNSTEVQLAHPKNPLNILQWLLRVPFSDENEGLRTYAGRWLGALLPFSRYKLLKSLYISEINSNLQQYFIPTRLFDDVDNMLHEFCGLTQSELSYTMKTVETAGTYSSNTNMHEVTKSCSRQISAIRFISGLCQHLEEGDEWKSLILEKGLIRLMRFWVSASMQALEERYDSLNHGEVAEEAFRELLCLRQMGIFSNKEIPNFDQAVVPGFISDIISKTLFAQSVKSRAGNSDYGNSLLCQFVQFFLVGNPIDDCTSSEIDRLYKVLGCFDSALPATIAGLVLEKDYEAICECTKFRLYLLSELKRLGRKSKDDSLIDEKILGEIASKRKQSSSKASSDEELRRQTSRLCVMKGNDFNILGPILNVLLLEQDKSPLVFFLKKVVGSKVSFGVLLKKSEFMVLDDLVCELGICEEQPGDNDFAREVLKTFYQDQRAYQAMKRAVLFLQSVKDTKQQSSEESLSCSFDINDDSSLTTMNTDQLVEEWVRKYYMRLLVNVTTKWKRGSLQTKISAMRCLRVLLRFIPIEDSPQYATQVFGIVDGCMYLDSNFAETDKRLQFLAVRCLSCFVRVLLSFNLQVVGDNLCNIIVSLSPLFNEVSTDIIASNNENPILSQTVNDAIEILETLVDGKIGKKLAPYFESVPFLPKDSRLHNVRDTLKRHGINFDNLLLLSTQLNCSEPPVRSRDSISSSLSSSVEEEKVLTSHRNKVHFALKKRLNSLEKLLNHENDNVRKLSLMHIIGVVSEHRDLFQNVIKVEDASLRFLTVKSDSLTIKGK